MPCHTGRSPGDPTVDGPMTSRPFGIDVMRVSVSVAECDLVNATPSTSQREVIVPIMKNIARLLLLYMVL